MALQDLYKVTETLRALLKQNIMDNIDTNIGLLEVTDGPPEKVGTTQNALNIYLYHITEDPYYKNAAGPGNDARDVATTPMALCLFYILSAHHETDTSFDAATQQKLMGYALKTFHDFPVITDHTEINGIQILASNLQGKGNSLQIIMRPVSPEDAIAFWGSEETKTTRLSAYYEVRVVMLEPEPPKRMPGIVLSLGTFLTQLGSPHFDRSESVVSFSLPTSTGITSLQQIEASPARVSTDPGTAEPPNNHLVLRGTNLAIGKSRSLILKNALWARQGFDSVEIDFALDPPTNKDWLLVFGSDRIELNVQKTLKINAGLDLILFPGTYTATLQVVKDEQVILNQLKPITDSSNEVVFFVAPRIKDFTPPAPGPDKRITVTIEPEFDLKHGEGGDEELEIRVVMAGRTYERGNFDSSPPNPEDNDGLFEVGTDSVTFQAFEITPGEHPFRLIVNGAESAPFWIEIT